MPVAYSYLRFSSSEQAKGNSFERQIRLRDAYVARKGLTLDTSLHLQDAGVSAFPGMNASTGALKGFLDACESGRVRPGSYLILENLDRLSRDEKVEAAMLFLNILKKNITLVTLSPEQEYKGDLGVPHLVLAVAELARGHGESLIKSERSRSNWEKRRRNIANEILTGRKPSWIDIEKEKFVLNPTKVKTVRRIFDMAVKGHGIGNIVSSAFLPEQNRGLFRNSPRPVDRGKVFLVE